MGKRARLEFGQAFEGRAGNLSAFGLSRSSIHRGGSGIDRVMHCSTSPKV